MGDFKKRKKCPKSGQALPMTGGVSFLDLGVRKKDTQMKARKAAERPEEGRG